MAQKVAHASLPAATSYSCHYQPHSILSVASLYVLCTTEMDELPIEEKLFNYILRRYNRDIRPVQLPTEAVGVHIMYSLMQINELVSRAMICGARIAGTTKLLFQGTH